MPENSWTPAQAPVLTEDDQQLPLPSDVPRPKDENCPANSLFSQSHISGSHNGNGGTGNIIGDGNTIVYVAGHSTAIPGVRNQGGQPSPWGAESRPKENPIPNRRKIGRRLKGVITNRQRGLGKLYGETEAELDRRLEAPIKKGEEMARKLITETGCPLEIAKDLTVLTLYDVAILIDDSGSMIREENGERKKALIQFVDRVTEIYSMANESGILSMRFINGGGGKKNWTGESQEYLDHHSYGGVSRIGTELKKEILDRLVIGNPNQSKPLLVLIVTGRAVEGERRGLLKTVIRDCVNERKRAGKGFGAVLFQFIRVGSDRSTAQLLLDLDQDPDLAEFVGVLPFKFNPEYQPEDKWDIFRMILLGAILPEVDPPAQRSTKHGEQWDEKYDAARTEVADWLSDDEEEDAGDTCIREEAQNIGEEEGRKQEGGELGGKEKWGLGGEEQEDGRGQEEKGELGGRGSWRDRGKPEDREEQEDEEGQGRGGGQEDKEDREEGEGRGKGTAEGGMEGWEDKKELKEELEDKRERGNKRKLENNKDGWGGTEERVEEEERSGGGMGGRGRWSDNGKPQDKQEQEREEWRDRGGGQEDREDWEEEEGRGNGEAQGGTESGGEGELKEKLEDNGERVNKRKPEDKEGRHDTEGQEDKEEQEVEREWGGGGEQEQGLGDNAELSLKGVVPAPHLERIFFQFNLGRGALAWPLVFGIYWFLLLSWNRV